MRMDDSLGSHGIGSPNLFPWQIVARIEPGYVLLEEGMALGFEGFRRVEI